MIGDIKRLKANHFTEPLTVKEESATNKIMEVENEKDAKRESEWVKWAEGFYADE